MRHPSFAFMAFLIAATVPAQVIARGGGHSSHSSSSGSHYVAPHVMKNGTYVNGHYRSNPNGSTADNWSTKGNINPYTGEGGKMSPTAPSHGLPATLSAHPSSESSRQQLTVGNHDQSTRHMSAEPKALTTSRLHDDRNQSTRVRAMRSAFVHRTPCPSTGRTTGACPGYVVDHIIPLCANGPDLPSNMQWQTVAAAKQKDVSERASCRR